MAGQHLGSLDIRSVSPSGPPSHAVFEAYPRAAAHSFPPLSVVASKSNRTQESKGS